MDALDARLGLEPTVESRNRKRLDENSLDADYELRVGKIRVYYCVDEGRWAVNVLAVGLKDRNRVIIGGVEIDL